MDSGNVSLPFIDNQFPSFFIRSFSKNLSNDSLVWHKDEKCRVVTVLAGTGWKLQLDNQIPVDLSPGVSLQIPKNIFHRIIKTSSENSLLLKIKE